MTRRSHKWHQGNAARGGFTAYRMPDVNGETRSGWNMYLDTGTANGATFPGVLRLTFSRLVTPAQDFRYRHATNATISPATTFDMSGDFNLVSNTNVCGYLGFWNSASGNGTNDIRVSIYDACVMITAHNSTSTAIHGSTGSGISTGTQYWYRFRNDATNISFDVYSTRALADAGSTGDVSQSVLEVSTIAGTVTCNRYGWSSIPTAGNVRNMVFDINYFDGDRVNWYE